MWGPATKRRRLRNERRVRVAEGKIVGVDALRRERGVKKETSRRETTRRETRRATRKSAKAKARKKAREKAKTGPRHGGAREKAKAITKEERRTTRVRM